MLLLVRAMVGFLRYSCQRVGNCTTKTSILIATCLTYMTIHTLSLDAPIHPALVDVRLVEGRRRSLGEQWWRRTGRTHEWRRQDDRQPLGENRRVSSSTSSSRRRARDQLPLCAWRRALSSRRRRTHLPTPMRRHQVSHKGGRPAQSAFRSIGERRGRDEAAEAAVIASRCGAEAARRVAIGRVTAERRAYHAPRRAGPQAHSALPLYVRAVLSTLSRFRALYWE